MNLGCRYLENLFVIPNYGRGVNEGLIQKARKSTKPEIVANQTVLIEIIKAEAYVPLHLKIEAVELVPNPAGKWVEGPKIYFDKIDNKVDQNEPEDYNLDGSKEEPTTEVHIDQATFDILSLWFNETNAESLAIAIEDSRSKIKSHEDLHREALLVQDEKDGRKLPLATLKQRIKI